MRRKRRYISVCAERGCPELADERFCDKHRRDDRRAIEGRRESAQSKGYDAQWRKTRLEFLRAYPVCQDEMGCVAKATDVDHIDGLGPKAPGRYAIRITPSERQRISLVGSVSGPRRRVRSRFWPASQGLARRR